MKIILKVLFGLAFLNLFYLLTLATTNFEIIFLSVCIAVFSFFIGLAITIRMAIKERKKSVALIDKNGMAWYNKSTVIDYATEEIEKSFVCEKNYYDSHLIITVDLPTPELDILRIAHAQINEFISGEQNG